MKSSKHPIFFLNLILLCATTPLSPVSADGNTSPLSLLDPAAATSAQQISASDGQTSFSVNGENSARGIDVTIQPGSTDYPGITIKPPTGAVWDLSAYGHVEALISNTGDNPVQVSLRIDNEGDWQLKPWSASNTEPLVASQSHLLSVIFGYAYGQPAFPLNPAAVNQIIVYVEKTTLPLKFRIEKLQAAGSPGEKATAQSIPVKIKQTNGVCSKLELCMLSGSR